MKVGFTVKATTALAGSTADLAKKNKGSVSSITKVGQVMTFHGVKRAESEVKR